MHARRESRQESRQRPPAPAIAGEQLIGLGGALAAGLIEGEPLRAGIVEGIEERFGSVKVSVAEVRVEHQVKIADFMKWLERPGRTPREITQRQKIRAILGMSVSS